MAAALAAGRVFVAGRSERRRRRTLLLAVVFALGAASAGSALGILAKPGPGRQWHAEQLVWTAAAATEAARTSEARAASAERALAEAKARIEALDAVGAGQELADYEEAQRLGLSRLMKSSTALWGDDRRRALAAIVRESRRHGLDPALVAAVIHVESRFDPFAVSRVGACGLMQLMPPTAQWLLETDDKDDGTPRLRPAHLFNPVLNIDLGTTYLAALMARFDGDLTRALIAYNAGPSVARAIRRGSPAWKRLSQYPNAVLAAYKAVLTPPQQLAAR